MAGERLGCPLHQRRVVTMVMTPAAVTRETQDGEETHSDGQLALQYME